MNRQQACSICVAANCRAHENRLTYLRSTSVASTAVPICSKFVGFANGRPCSMSSGGDNMQSNFKSRGDSFLQLGLETIGSIRFFLSACANIDGARAMMLVRTYKETSSRKSTAEVWRDNWAFCPATSSISLPNFRAVRSSGASHPRDECVVVGVQFLIRRDPPTLDEILMPWSADTEESSVRCWVVSRNIALLRTGNRL